MALPRGGLLGVGLVTALAAPGQGYMEVTHSQLPPQPVARPSPGGLDDGGGTERPERRIEPVTAEPIVLAAQRVRVVIRDQVAVVTVSHVFQNTTDRILQARYAFPLGTRAHVSGYAIWEQGQRLPGELLEVRRAEALYEAVTQQELTPRSEGQVAQEVRRVEVARDPGILRQLAPGSFETHVYPILPWALKQVELLYGESVPAEDGWCRWSFPLEEAGRALENPVGELELTVELGDSAGLGEVECSWPEATVTRAGDRVQVRLQARDLRPERPFELRWRTGLRALEASVLAHRPAGSGEGWALLRVGLPGVEAGAERPLDVVLLVDGSGSLCGDKAARQARALEHLLGALGQADRVQALRFAEEVEVLWPDGLRGADPSRRAEVMAWLQRGPPAGRTHLAPALRAAFAAAGPRDPARGRLVVLASDGVSEEDPADVIGSLQPDGTQLLVLGSGHDDDHELLEALVERHGGILWVAGSGERLERWAARDPGLLMQAYGAAVGGDPQRLDPSPLLRRLRSPAVAGLVLEGLQDQAGLLLDLHPVVPCRSWPGGGTATFLARYERAGEARLRLRATVDGQAVDEELQVTLPERADQHRFVSDFWARARALELLRLHPWGDDDPQREEVVRLSLAHGFMTPYTAFLSLPDVERRRMLLGEGQPRDDEAEAYSFATSTGGAPEAEVWALLLVGLLTGGLLLRRERAATQEAGSLAGGLA